MNLYYLNYIATKTVKKELFIKHLVHHNVKLVKPTPQRAVSVLIQTQLLYFELCCSQSCGLFTDPLEYM